MVESSEQQKRLVTYGPLAATDLAENHTHTTYHWGFDQAEQYTSLLIESANKIAIGELIGRSVEGHPGVFAVLVRWKSAHHGHFIVYKPVEGGIYILRILHSAMDLPQHL